MKLSKADVGKKFIANGKVVTLIGLNAWDGVVYAHVTDPSTPNPSNIPGLENFYYPVALLKPVEIVP